MRTEQIRRIFGFAMLESHDIDERIARFRADLKRLTVEEVVRRHIIHGSCAVLDEDAYYAIRKRIATYCGVHLNDVLVVGSAKLGFSIAPKKRWRHFGDRSDIDVIVVSSDLFCKLWKAVYVFRDGGGYWENFTSFKDYLFRGWMRPDKLPPAQTFKEAMDWWEFFNEISGDRTLTPYKISGAVYKDWHFLESYQSRATSGCCEANHA